jgi:hypothetical protein
LPHNLVIDHIIYISGSLNQSPTSCSITQACPSAAPTIKQPFHFAAFFAAGFFLGVFFETGFFLAPFFKAGFFFTVFFTVAFFAIGFFLAAFLTIGFFFAFFLASGFCLAAFFLAALPPPKYLKISFKISDITFPSFYKIKTEHFANFVFHKLICDNL